MSNRYELSNINSDKNKLTLTLDLQESDLFNQMLPKQVELVLKKEDLKSLLGTLSEATVEEKAASKKSK